MRYCGHFLMKAEGGAKNYERDHPLPLSWRPITVVFVHRKGYTLSTNYWRASEASETLSGLYKFKLVRYIYICMEVYKP